MASPLSQEIERKFLVKTPPVDYTSFDHQHIKQGYLTERGSATEIRVREKGGAFYQTIKRGEGLVREETEIALTKAQFEALWPLTQGRRLEKTRYLIPYEGHTIELDVYGGTLDSLITAEVEFESVASSASFSPPEWMGREVTEDLHYGNVNLALDGVPEQFRAANG